MIGLRKENAIERFLTQRHSSFDLAQGDVHLQGALVEIDEATGHARSIARVQQRVAE